MDLVVNAMNTTLLEQYYPNRAQTPLRAWGAAAGFFLSLARLLAKDAIGEVLARYARAVDSADLALIRSVYWPEATDDHGNFSGNAMEFAEFAVEVLKGFRTTMHFLTNIGIDFPTQDQADVQCYFYAYHEHVQEPDGSPPMVTIVGGRYLDRFEQRGDEWRILTRIVTMDWNEHRPSAALGIEAQQHFQKHG